MVKDSTSVLSNKNAVPIMIQLLEKETTSKSDLLKVSSMHTINNILSQLEKEGYVNVEEEFIGRRTYLISLTPKGRAVAEQLKRAEEAAEGISTEEIPEIKTETDEKGEKIYVLTPEYRKTVEERRKKLSALIHVNVLDDHIAFKETNYNESGKDRIVTVYVRLNGNGILRLWCDADETYDCWHTNEAWALPEVREMYFNQVRKGNVRSDK